MEKKPNTIRFERGQVRNVADLRPHPRNPNQHSPEQVRQIADSMDEFGFTVGCLIDESDTILAGHGRVMAAQLRGDTTVPVDIAYGMTEQQKLAYVVADNQLPRNATWNMDLLPGIVMDLKTDGYAIELLGFPDVELTQFISGLGDGSAPMRTVEVGDLATSFGVVPFSVLNARTGWWQERKRAWIAIGIRSELGRGEEQPQGETSSLRGGAHVQHHNQPISR